MKIIKHGNRVESDEILTCPGCGCEFEPMPTEKYTDSFGWYACCPECMAHVNCKPGRTIGPSPDEIRRDKVINDIVESWEYSDEGMPSAYERIHNIMVADGWTWAFFKDGNSGCHIPSIQEIKEESIHRMKEAWEKKATISSGGLKASYGHDDDTGEEWLELTFEIENICTGIGRDNDLLYY